MVKLLCTLILTPDEFLVTLLIYYFRLVERTRWRVFLVVFFTLFSVYSVYIIIKLEAGR